jgi:drug/metabolite transporter (DMT)-like permease
VTVGARAGALLALTSAAAYGVTVVIGRSLADSGLGAATALGFRFTVAAALLLAVQALRGGSLLPAAGERLPVILLGTVGYAVESTCFFLALERGTAAAVALLFYSYPAMVAVAELMLGTTRLTPRLGAGIVLAVTGTAAVGVTGGDVTISAAGIGFAIAAAVTFTLYLLAGDRYARRTASLVKAAWVSGGAGLSIGLRGLLAGELRWPGGDWLALGGYAVANAVAFGLLFAALGRIGATRTAVLLTFEVVAAIVLAAIFLGEQLEPAQAVGGLAIIGGAILVVLAAAPAEAIVEEAPTP